MRLRSKLTLTLLALALVPLATATWVLVRLNLGRLELSAKEFRLAVADDVARLVRSTVTQARSELGAMSAALSQPNVSGVERERAARNLLLGANHVHNVALYDRRGKFVMALRSEQIKDLLPHRASLGEGVRGIARTEGVALYGVTISGAGSPHLPLMQPIFVGREHTLYGYLWTSISLRPLSAELARVSRRRFGRNAERVFLIDETLRVIAHGRPSAVAKPLDKTGIARALGGDGKHLRRDVALSAEYSRAGEPLLGVLLPLKELGWGVVVEQPRAQAYAAIRTTWITGLAVGGAFLVIALVIGLWVGRRLASPVQAVARAAREVAAGNLEQRIECNTRDEVGEMAESFNSMAQDLQSFEKRVVEETRIRSDLSRYLSAELVDGIVNREIELKLGGERREITVVFADVVAFTPLTEKHDPEQVVAVLNELFTFMTEIVFRHGGIVDKFMGDCIMAVFGVPRPQEDTPLRAVRAAEEMMRWLETGNVRWRKELGSELQLGIGINTGQAIAGNIGSERRMEYTVIGNVVNVAARLESIARPGQVLMTEETFERVADEFECEPLGSQHLVGKLSSVQVYALMD